MTPRLGLGRALRSRASQSVGVALAVGLLTASGYFLLLGWGRRTQTGVNAYLTAPSHGGSVLLLVLALAIVALAAGWVGRPIVGSIALAVALTTCWALDAALNVRGDRNWPIGMTLVAWASFGGSLVLSGIVAESRLRARQRADEAMAAEQARLLAEARRAQAARLAAERAAALELAAAEAAHAEQARLAAAARAADAAAVGTPADRRTKVVQAFRTSAAKVRSNAPKGRAKAS